MILTPNILIQTLQLHIENRMSAVSNSIIIVAHKSIESTNLINVDVKRFCK